MYNPNSRIPKEIAPDVFAIATHLYNPKKQDYSLAELTQAGAKAQIPPELIQQALDQIQQTQIQARERKQKLKVILISGVVGAGLARLSLWGYNTVSNRVDVRRSTDLNNPSGINDLIPSPVQPSPPASVAQPDTRRTNFSGKVERYLLNPEGLVDGLMLSNGLQVKFPPHMTNSLITTVKVGDSIKVVGDSGIPSSLAQEIHAFSITNTTTQRTVVNQPPADPPPSPSNSYSNLSVEGTAQHWLVGHRGEIKGIILSSGAQVRFPPHVGDQLFNTAKLGASIQAQGFGTSTNYGQVLEVTSLKVNGQPINLYPAGFWPKKHKKQF